MAFRQIILNCFLILFKQVSSSSELLSSFKEYRWSAVLQLLLKNPEIVLVVGRLRFMQKKRGTISRWSIEHADDCKQIVRVEAIQNEKKQRKFTGLPLTLNKSSIFSKAYTYKD